MKERGIKCILASLSRSFESCEKISPAFVNKVELLPNFWDLVKITKTKFYFFFFIFLFIFLLMFWFITELYSAGLWPSGHIYIMSCLVKDSKGALQASQLIFSQSD